MAEIRWTKQAADDLEAITSFIAEDSIHYASLFALDGLSAVERLETFPFLGRIVPEINNPSIREIILGYYRIAYQIRGELIEILTIYHTARLLDPSRLEIRSNYD
ncbi:MAG TPA: type II toxin-antitoxin system RelE/ParE family toxin [Candidatus Hydrogenedentes bacterium]|nr:type II toxin-antitoxin system RelE/ParE family toxin [Candidatus Hydrogenedentota bacterium]